MRDEKLDKLLAKRAKLEAQIKAAKKAVSEDARKADNHAKMLAGGMVLSNIGVSWNEVDFERLAMALSRVADEYKSCTCEALPLQQAKKRLRNWEVLHNPWGSYEPPVEESTEEKAAADEPQDGEARDEVSAGAGPEAGDGASDVEGAAAEAEPQVYMTRYWQCPECRGLRTYPQERPSDTEVPCEKCGAAKIPVPTDVAQEAIAKYRRENS
ncbi:MAG: hypothetical protein ACI36Y_02750 [Coriobacteriales bacterium]